LENSGGCTGGGPGGFEPPQIPSLGFVLFFHRNLKTKIYEKINETPFPQEKIPKSATVGE